MEAESFDDMFSSVSISKPAEFKTEVTTKQHVHPEIHQDLLDIFGGGSTNAPSIMQT